jgi:hypothetical protein
MHAGPPHLILNQNTNASSATREAGANSPGNQKTGAQAMVRGIVRATFLETPGGSHEKFFSAIGAVLAFIFGKYTLPGFILWIRDALRKGGALRRFFGKSLRSWAVSYAGTGS